jgi:hypothetical protein
MKTTVQPVPNWGKYLIILLFTFLWNLKGTAQSCAGFSFTYTTTESRCVATGTITINVTGGGGSYNYRAISATDTTEFTSTNVITALPPGSYKVIVQDVSVGGCGTIEQENVIVTGNYTSPNPTLVKKEVSCAGDDGVITVASVTGGRPPFTYTILPLSASNVGASNSTGIFTNLIPGEYSIQLEDSCGGLETRIITLLEHNWNVSSAVISRSSCDSADAVITLQDNKGNTNASGSAFAGYSYGLITPAGDTIWHTSRNFRFYIGHQLSGRVVAKDPCGNIFGRIWNVPANQVLTLGTVTTSNYRCDSTFTARISGSTGLTNPSFCLYNSSDVLISCNSTGTFNNLRYGSYCIKMTDECYDTTITRCFVSVPPRPSVAAVVEQSNFTCTTFTARINSRNNLTGATYCLVRNDGTTVACNATGTFTNVPYGSYCINIASNPRCYDTTIVRCFTAARPLPVVDAVRMTSNGCNTVVVDTVRGQSEAPANTFCLYYPDGTVICNNTGVFPNVPHGNYCIRSVSDCGDTSVPYCFNTQANLPSVGANVTRTNRTCSTFTAYINDTSRLVRPLYSLYDGNNNLLRSDSIGIFTNLPYGSYCIAVKNDASCYDTTFRRCFTESRPPINVDAEITQSNETCNSFRASITGTGLTNPTYYLLNTHNDTVATNTTGVFDNVAYGAYCIVIKDGCDTTIRVCQNLTALRGIALSADRSCVVNSSQIGAQMISPYSPYSYYYYHPDGRLVHSITNSWSSNPRVDLPSLPTGSQYKVVGVDNCGQKDSAYVSPAVNILSKSFSIRQKCPSGTWATGSGDLTITSSSNPFGRVTPKLIRKNGAVINGNFTTRNGNTYTFLDLGPATYVIEYTVNSCGTKAYDTVTVNPYAAPEPLQSPVYQCDNNSFSVNSIVINGIGPFTYEITGSVPATPSIVTGPQTSPFFAINTGIVYSRIDLRVTDACNIGRTNNAHILPLGNVVISSTSQCLYQDIVLSVDAIPNATYQWYKKTSATDSTLVGTGTTYSIPFMEEDDIAMYVCKTFVNNNCLTKLSYIDMKGDCGGITLPAPLQLSARKIAEGNQLSWNVEPGAKDIEYRLERKAEGEDNYTTIALIGARNGSLQPQYTFLDDQPGAGANLYRVKRTAAGKVSYSNTVTVSNKEYGVAVYPNPVKEQFTVTINNKVAANYRIALYSIDGGEVFHKQLYNITNMTTNYATPAGLAKGTYILRITNQSANTTENVKLLFQ